MSQRAYSDEEVKEILQRAVEQEASRDAGKLTHEELVSAAGEIGIGADAVERAAVELWLSRASDDDERDLRIYQRGRRLSLLRGLLIFAAGVSAALVSQMLLGVGDWVLIPLPFWAFLLSARAVQVFFQDPEKAKRAASKNAHKRRRRERLQRGRSRRAAPAPKRAPARAAHNPNVSALVEEGVGLLLEVMAAHQQQRGHAPQGDFGRYVQQKRGGPTRARVDASGPDEEEADELESTRGKSRSRR